MAITFVNAGAIAANASGDITPALPTGWANNDIDLLLVWVRDSTDTIAVSGWTEIAAFTRGATSKYYVFGRRLQTGDTAPLVNSTLEAGNIYGAHYAFNGCITTETAWEVVGSTATGTTDPATLNGITVATAGSMVVALLGGEDNNNGGVTITGTDPASYTANYQESATGADGMLALGYAIKSGTGATGNVSVDFDTAVPVGWGGVVIALKPVPAATFNPGMANRATSIVEGGF